MKVALVHKRYDRLGGAEGDCYETSRQLAARGHEVHLVVGECRVPAPEGVAVHRVPIVRAGQLAKLLSFAAAAPKVWRRVGAEVVIGFGRTVGQDLLRASGGCHGPYLARMAAAHGRVEALRHALSVYQRAILAIERRQYAPGAYGKILAVSTLVQREILETYPAVRPEDVVVLPYGVDVARFDPAVRAREGAAVRRELGVPLEQPLVLTVGTGFRRKGIDVLLEVWRRQPPGGAALVVVGNDQHLAAYCRAARALPGPVVFTGPRRDVERLYAAAEVLAGALAELVVDDPCDHDAVAAALRRGLAPGCRATLAGAARATACAHSLETSVRALERCCAAVAAGRGGARG